MKRAALVISIFLGTAAALAAWSYSSFQTNYILTARASAEAAGVRQSLVGLDQLEKLGSRGVMIALDRSLFDKINAALSGKSVTIHSEHLQDDVRLTVSAASLTPAAGRMAASVDVVARAASSAIEVGFHVEGFAYFAGITSRTGDAGAEGPVFSANFRMVPVSLVPSIRFGFVNLTGRRFANDLVTAGVMRLLFDKLTWSAPYIPRLAIPDMKPFTLTQHFGENGSGTLVAAVTPPHIAFERWLDVTAPIFTSRGVVLASSLSENRPVPAELAVQQEGAVDAAGLEADERSVDARSSSIRELFDKDVAITIGADALTSLSSSLSAALAGKVISARGQSVSGRFFDKKWSDKILGDGGFFAEAADSGRIEASVAVSAPTLSMDANVGPKLTAPVTVSVSAPIHVHVDPLIGGGVGTVVGIVGSGSAVINARLGTGDFPFEGHHVAMVGPDIACTVAHITALTDGKLKIGSGWATVPQIGAKIDQLIGKDPLDPVILFGLPLTRPLVQQEADAQRRTGSYVVKGLFATASLSAFAARARLDGYRMSFAFDASIGETAPEQPTSDQVSRLKKAASDHWAAANPQRCPDVEGIRIEIGDVEIGPNNEVVKFLKNAWSDITTGPGKENEVRKLLDRMSAAAGSYDDETKRLANDVGALASMMFPANTAAGHAAGELGKSTIKVLTNPAGAAADFGTQLFNGFK